MSDPKALVNTLDAQPKRKPGRPPGVKGKSITLYLSHEVADYLKATGCPSQVVEDLVRQFELPKNPE